MLVHCSPCCFKMLVHDFICLKNHDVVDLTSLQYCKEINKKIFSKFYMVIRPIICDPFKCVTNRTRKTYLPNLIHDP